jgi:hypothetical protein
MAVRDRFLETLRGGSPSPLPDMEFGYWDKTIAVWHEQGLPRDIRTNADLERHLGLEGLSIIPELPVHIGLFPDFEERVIEEKNGRRLVVDREGALCEKLDFDSTMPRYIRFAVETREDWERLRDERLDPARPGRIGDVRRAADEAHAAGMPVTVHCGSLYGRLRNWMGLENLSLALMTDRDWVEEMMEHLTGLALRLIEDALPGVEADAAWWWEDMCYNHGPLLSPRLFEDLMVPRYRRITDALRRHGVEINVLDCDGRIDALVPGWLRAGIDVMFPVEAIHTNPLRLRRDFGSRIRMIGGVNKMSLIAGRGAIDREIESLAPLVAEGGVIPCVDHRVPPDVTFENYLYYLERKRTILL